MKYFLVFWIVKHIQLDPNIETLVSQMNQMHYINQIDQNRENQVNQMNHHMNQINQKAIFTKLPKIAGTRLTKLTK